MSDTDNGQNNPEGQTGASMPNAEQPAEVAQEPTLPDGAKARTVEEFEKLKEHNRQLAEELKALKGSNPSLTTVFDELRPSAGTVVQPPVPVAGNPVVDDGGYIDAALLNKTLTESERKAAEATRIALQTQEQIQRFQETQIQKEVQKDFPEFDPNTDKFNPAFYEFVKNELVGQLLVGRNQDLRAAAAKAREVFKTKTPDPVRQENISSREQASAPTGTRTVSAPTTADNSALVERTYKGDKDAIFERLKRSGY